MEQKYLEQWNWEEQKCTCVGFTGETLRTEPVTPQPIPEPGAESDTTSHVFLPVNRKRWKNPDSYIETEIIKWQVTKCTANITTITICE